MTRPPKDHLDPKEQSRIDHGLVDIPIKWIKSGLLAFVKIKIAILLFTALGIGIILLTNWRPAGGYWHEMHRYDRMQTSEESQTVYLDGELCQLVLSENDIPFYRNATFDSIGFWIVQENGEYTYSWIRADRLTTIGDLPKPGDRIRLIKEAETRSITLLNYEGHEQFSQSYEEWIIDFFERKNIDFTELFPEH